MQNRIGFLVIGAELPKSWIAPIDTYQEVVLTPKSPEYSEVEKNFGRTIGNVQLQQGVLEVSSVLKMLVS